MALSAEHFARITYEIETLGFTVVDETVPKDSCDALRTALLDALESDATAFSALPGKKPDLVNNLALYGGPFLDLLDNAVMRAIFSHFLTPACILYNYSSTVLHPGAASDVQHIHVDSPRVIPGYHDGLIMTLALDDFTEVNGATYYLPGSHTLATIPNPETFERYRASVARSKGAAVFFNPRCFHRGGQNNSDRTRAGVTIFAVRPFMKQRFDFPRMIDPASLTPSVQQFLGFDARMPSAMTEFYVEPDRRLYKGGQE
jgi:ectoine hydroxylase-related dioxygenase (phytanoyl-CoA dioxygenase family)